ncbi:MAG: type I 3-dehydroquinate dehydratase [Methanoregula sp.]|nr:type I 3-dehydroquinate dehydratase [Methanoregula sp.]
MKIVASLTDPEDARRAEEEGAEVLELRLDLVEGDHAERATRTRTSSTLPIIGTLRSASEGGRYFGNPEEWITRIRPVIRFFDYIDIEQRYAKNAAEVRAAGRKVIASFHTPEMPDLVTLYQIERELRSFGDIVKMIVTPRNEEDVIELIAFTHSIRQPICTGVMGEEFRYARAVLPLFGSELVYCHTGTPTAAGQYSVPEFRKILTLLGRQI